MNIRLLAMALCAIACSRSAAQTPDLAAIARASGTPDIPGLKMVWLAPWGELVKSPSLAQHHRAPDRRAGRLGARRRAGAGEEPDPARRHGLGRDRRHGVLGGRRNISFPTHGDGANRNDNKYIDNRPTYRQVVGDNSIGVEFAGNYPDVRAARPRRRSRRGGSW